MEVDGIMSSNDYLRHHQDGRVVQMYFYRVVCERSTVSYRPRTSGNPRLFQAQCEFAYSHLTKGCIEEHVRLSDSRATSFVSVFSDFVQALKRAYFLYAQGYEAIQIVQINASSLIRTVQIGSEDGHGSLIPVWQGPAGGSDNWLCMAEIGPLLGVDPRYVQKSEWLACGSVPSFRYSSAWPIIDGKLFFGEETGEDLVDLFTCVCGHPPDYIRQHENSGRYEYNWESGRFLETDWWRNRNSSVQQSGLASSRVGLGVAASRFAHPTIFGHTGYLRGMIVMD